MFVSNFLLVCISIHSLIKLYHCREPHCSKFHYEESLLEKVIRLEIKFEQMANGYEEMVKLISEERQKLGEDTENMKQQIEKYLHDGRAELETLKNNVDASRELVLKESQDVKSSFETFAIDNENKLARISGDVNQRLNETFTKLSVPTHIPDVFFEVKEISQTAISSNQVFKFKTVVKSSGDDYDIDNGVFTAPVDGDYFFTAQFCLNGQYVYPSYVIDGVEQKRTSIRSITTSCGNFNLLSKLKTGSRLSIIATSSSDIFDDTYRKNFFAGMLIKK